MAASVSIEKHKEKLSFLPKKLYDRLMPFQRDGVLFGIAKKGRSVHTIPDFQVLLGCVKIIKNSQWASACLVPKGGVTDCVCMSVSLCNTQTVRSYHGLFVFPGRLCK